MGSAMIRNGALILGMVGAACSERAPMPKEWNEVVDSLVTDVDDAIQGLRQPGTVDYKELHEDLVRAQVTLNEFLPKLENHFFPNGDLSSRLRDERDRLDSFTCNESVGLGLIADLKNPDKDSGIEFGLDSFSLNLSFPSEHALQVGYNFRKQLEAASYVALMKSAE